MTIPRTVRSAVGLAAGDMVDVRAIGNKIVITPQWVIDRSKFPTAGDEYTPEERRALDASLAESEKGPYYGPFKSGAEITAFMKKRLRGARPSKSNNSR
jgi:bifunctional DNA-binding transcriptional regulator/antitoxin component of YhaV-PrlF toxin-antitoxin module